MPSNDLTCEISGEAAVVDPGTRAALCEGEDGLPQLITTLLDKGVSNVLLDLHRVRSIDSLALAGIVQAHRSLTRRGGKLKIVNVGRRVRDLFEATRLASVFEIQDAKEAGSPLE